LYIAVLFILFSPQITMPDITEPDRCQRLAEINAQPSSREALEAQHGQVWNANEISRAFEVVGFMAPFIVVRQKSDGKKAASNSSTAQGFTSGSNLTRSEHAHDPAPIDH
jgi:hypothetical protein